MDANVLVDKYVKLRDKKATIKAEYDAKVGKVDEVLDKIEAVFLKHFQDTGVEAVKTASGTVYTSKRVSTKVADWDVFKEFVRQNDAFEMLEHRCSKNAVEEFRKVNDDLPPGVSWSEEVVVGVRRS